MVLNDAGACPCVYARTSPALWALDPNREKRRHHATAAGRTHSDPDGSASCVAKGSTPGRRVNCVERRCYGLESE